MKLTEKEKINGIKTICDRCGKMMIRKIRIEIHGCLHDYCDNCVFLEMRREKEENKPR